MRKGTRTHLKRRGEKGRKNPDRIDPRQTRFLENYINPKSETFGNVRQSGLRAGFSVKYSENLVLRMPAWLDEKLGDLGFITKAEQHFKEVLDMPIKKQVMGPFGPLFSGKGKKRKPVIDYHMGTIREKTQVAEFVAENLAKNKYGKDSSKELPPLQTIIIINAPNGKEAHRIHTVGETVGSVAVARRSDND